MEEEQSVTEVLIDESSRLGEAMQHRMEAADRFVGVAGSLTGVGLTLGFAQNQPLILVVLPIAIVVIFIFVLQIYTDASMHIGHRQALEELVNARMGGPVLVTHSVVAGKHPRRASVALSAVLIAIIWVGTAILGATKVPQAFGEDFGTGATFGYCALVLLSIITLIFALIENSTAQSAAYGTATDAYQSLLPPIHGS